MEFGNLNRWGDYWYLPLMGGLYVFDATGRKVAEWYVRVDQMNETWEFMCVVNTLKPKKEVEFDQLVNEWKQQVDARLTECFSGD